MTIYSPTYTTPETVHKQLAKANPSASATPAQAEYDDYVALVLMYITEASDYVTNECRRAFVPYRYSYEFNTRDGNVWRQLSRDTLYMPDDLLVVNSITNNSGTISPTQYERKPNYGVAYALNFYDETSTGSLDTLTIDGTWGYVRDYEKAFVNIEAIVGTLTASATTITVDDAEVYETLQYLRINGELVQIESINTATDVLTVSRGVNGTTAIEHVNYTIQRFNPIPAIALVTTRLTAFMYQRRNDSAGRVQYVDGSTALNEMPPFVNETLKHYRRSSYLPVF